MNSPRFIIVGAGLSGLIAASMLRDRACIFERQSSLPNNHSALLRFRSSVVGDAVGIPFREVSVMKSSHPWRNPVADAMAYSWKTTQGLSLRSVTSASGEIEKRFIAPDDFIPRMAGQIGDKIIYGEDLTTAMGDAEYADHMIISTIPMPALMKALGYPSIPEFKYRPGWTINAELPEWCDVCATVYLPNPKTIPYRASITGRRLIIEMAGEMEGNFEYPVRSALFALGLLSSISTADVMETAVAKEMTYAKIVPISDNERKRFILWASEHHNIFSLGRFATWRPGLLLDDLVNDVRTIDRIASGGINDNYNARKELL